jgi:hypothetical protein
VSASLYLKEYIVKGYAVPIQHHVSDVTRVLLPYELSRNAEANNMYVEQKLKKKKCRE